MGRLSPFELREWGGEEIAECEHWSEPSIPPDPVNDIVYYFGGFLSRDQVQISPNGRGWLLGDGVYEVAPSSHGAFLRLDLHLEQRAAKPRFSRPAG